ncbi:WXG100 family type VII secretion target [Streptomyces sp. DH37]|jgi:WXG100 family type VII secretion target|uniref:WXG100 family type VII secretion target n=1 Tax=Streptomyces sp. DH37 TaxID=3040122 RepID=UPI0024424F1C|nr:WXG100 family type VII secretion target [Streptomyces sp. DH37]MDG9704475.1 WXG100 family type VII secretion target [Streptomyces sp. DH37]
MTIKITYGTVTAAADDVRRVASELEGQLNALNARVTSVVATWDGEAQNAFHRKHKGWEENVNGLNTTLKAIAAGLDNAAAGYQRTDRRAAQQFEF